MKVYNPKYNPKKFEALFGPERMSGIFLHPTSLPSKFGIGDLGKNALKFIDYLKKWNQKTWQILPLSPTGYGNSPYQCFSAFAGNHLLISPVKLVEKKLLTKENLEVKENFPDSEVDFEQVKNFKNEIFKKAYSNFKLLEKGNEFKKHFKNFQKENSFWLKNFSVFMSLKELHNQKPWFEWKSKYKFKDKDSLDKYQKEKKENILYYDFLQYLFFYQWNEIKSYANNKGIKIFGDIPIFVAYDSSDVWGNPDYFYLDDKGEMEYVAGVPPDEFSETGQRWGNPLYRWDILEKNNFEWWIQRIQHSFKLVDFLRIDHFRGFESFWRIPSEEPTAKIGKWVKGPGYKFFRTLKEKLNTLPIIAEDLGVITPEVEELLENTGYPGMRVLQFAFGGKINEKRESKYLPHNYVPNTVVYTGTHDNNTTLGWYNSLPNKIQKRVINYIDKKENIVFELIKLAISSVSRICIIPLQDILELGEEARMNFPGTNKGNWIWRFTWDQLNNNNIAKFSKICEIYERD